MPADAHSLTEPRLVAAEAWLAGRRRGVVVGLVLAAAFVRLVFCLQIAAGPLPRVHEIVVSDNTFFDAWAKHLAAGDWLQREPMHPINPWMTRTAEAALLAEPGLPDRLGIPAQARADRESLIRALWSHWMGGAAYYQEPAYAYLVAATYLLTGPQAWHVYLWQMLLGLACVVLVHGIARRLFSDLAALAAAVLFVLSPVFPIHEVALLRDTLVVFATLGLAWLMLWVLKGDGEGGRRWFALGLACGAAMLVKVHFVFFPVLMGLGLVATERTKALRRWPAALWGALGVGLALLPAVARNLAVGVPPLALNASGTTMLAVYQTADASPFRMVVSPLYAKVLLASDGQFLSSLIAAVRTHPSVWSWVGLTLSKCAHVLHGYEVPNNVDLYLFRRASEVLVLLPVTIVGLAPLAALGLSRRSWPVLVALLGSATTLVMATVVARYRIPVVAALLPLAGAGLVRAVGWGLSRRWTLLGGLAAASAAYLAWACSPPAGLPDSDRADYYAAQGRWAGSVGEHGLEALCFAEAFRLEPQDASLELRWGQALVKETDFEQALPHLRRAAAKLGGAEARVALAEALLGLGRKDEAAHELRQVLAAEPGRASAKALLDTLERR